MNGLITPNRLGRVIDVPVSFSSTELNRSRAIHVAQIPLTLGQKLVMRTLTLHVPSALTPNVTPTLLNAALGCVSVGVYFGNMLTAPLAVAKMSGVGSCTVNPFSQHILATPGIYTVVVSNNTSNADYAVVVTGAFKLYF
jgi:hypothetical protein